MIAERKSSATCDSAQTSHQISNKRAAEQFEREVRQRLLDGAERKKEEVIDVPRFAKFADDFVETYAVTNNKPSEVFTKRSILRVHLKPAFGSLRLDARSLAASAETGIRLSLL